jgi:hypothetical protein
MGRWSKETWQDAVDHAEFFLQLDSCRQYGLITGGPTVNIRRAEEILRGGAKRGITPRPFDELCKRFLQTKAPDVKPTQPAN